MKKKLRPKVINLQDKKDEKEKILRRKIIKSICKQADKLGW